MSYKGAKQLSKNIEEYIKENKLDLDKVVDDFTPYVKTIIGNMNRGFLSGEDVEEVILDTFFVLWKSVELRKKNLSA